MKRILVVAAGLLLVASTAAATSGVNINLNDCVAGGLSTSITNACDSNSGDAFVAEGSVVMPERVVTGFVAAAAIIRVQTVSALPDWWQLGGCRSMSSTFTAGPTEGGSCGTVWDAAPAGTVVTSFVNYNNGDGGGYISNRLTIASVHFIQSDHVYDLVGDGATELGVFRWTVQRSHTLAPQTVCEGCSTGACIVLAEINLQPLVGDMSSWLRLVNPYQNFFLTYQTGGYPPCPASTPARNRSWGSIKSLYR